MSAPLIEYSIRLVIRVRRRGMDTPERRHKVVKSARDWITRSRAHPTEFSVDVCEVREARLVKETPSH